MPTGRIEDFVIPAGLLAEIDAAAKDDRRSAGEVVQEALESYLERRLQQMQREAQHHARVLGLRDDVAPLTDQDRQVIQEEIARGLASAKEGRLVDGEAVFSRLYAELDERERQGRG